MNQFAQKERDDGFTRKQWEIEELLALEGNRLKSMGLLRHHASRCEHLPHALRLLHNLMKRVERNASNDGTCPVDISERWNEAFYDAQLFFEELKQELG